MKKILITIVSLFVILVVLRNNQVYGQRRLHEQKGVQVTGGLVDGYGFVSNRKTAYHFGVALSSYNQKGDKWVSAVEYLEKKYCYECCEVPVSQFTGETGYYYNFWNNRNKDVFLSIGLSGLAGYEVANWGKKKFEDGATLLSKDRFIYGTAFTFEIETFIIDRLIFLFSFRERLTFNSDVGKFHNQIGIGIKYIYKQ